VRERERKREREKARERERERERERDYRVAKTHRMPYLYRSFSAKEPYT